MTDPMEQLIADALSEAGIDYARGGEPGNASRLDFYLPLYDIHIEVKRLHTPRVAEQMSRAENVIVAQGKEAVEMLALLIRRAA